MHTIFRITDIQEMDERLWLVELEMTNDKDEQLSEVLEQLRKEIHVSGIFNVDKVGQLCLKMGDYEGALNVYETLLSLFPDNQVMLAYVYQHLGLIYQNKYDLDEAIIYYEKAVETRHSTLAEDEADRYSAVTYANLSTLYVEKGELAQGRKYCERAIAAIMQPGDGKEIDPIVQCYHLANLAFIQHAEGNFNDSVANYQKVVDLYLKHLPVYHPDLVIAYSNLAVVHQSMKNYMVSVECLTRALEISKKSFSETHESLGTLHYNIAVAHENCQKYDEALKHIQCAIEIGERVEWFDKEKVQRWRDYAEELRQTSNIN